MLSHPLGQTESGKVFAMLQAYMDDSGTHIGSHNCVVAGYWAGVNEWRRFERQWNRVLKREGIVEFKANEFWLRLPGNVRVGPYKGWTDERHAKFINDLLSVISDAKITPFGCGVLGAEWSAQPADLKSLYTSASCERHAKSMLLPFQRNIYRAASYCLPGVTMHFVFDESTEAHVKSAITNCYSNLKMQAAGDRLRSHLGEITFADSDQAAPLQAADLLAYEMHRFAKKPKRDLSDMRVEYRRALVHFKTKEDFWLFDYARFSSLTTKLQAITHVERGAQ